MSKFCWPLALLAWSLATSAVAQAPAKPDTAAEADAAMERAKRQAAGPMRIILEASKTRRKPGENEAAPGAAADASNVRPVATRAAGAAANPPASTPPPAPALTPAAAPAPTPAAPPPAALGTPTLAAASTLPAGANATNPANSVSNADRVATPVKLDAGTLAVKSSAAAVTGLEQSSTLGPIVAPLAAAPTVTVPQMQANDRVRLLSMVQPEVPQRVLDEMGRNAAILVELNLRPDGSVASVDLVSAAPRGLLRTLAPSLEQWKFAPLTSQRKHRVELLFNVEP